MTSQDTYFTKLNRDLNRFFQKTRADCATYQPEVMAAELCLPPVGLSFFLSDNQVMSLSAVQTMMSYSIIIILQINGRAITPGSCKSNQAPTPSVVSCTHEVNVFAVEPGCLSVLLSYLPSAALLDVGGSHLSHCMLGLVHY